MQKSAIVIPCYNEFERLQSDKFLHFLHAHPGIDIYFVDDSSSDSTPEILNKIKHDCPNQTFVLQHEHNKGKAAAVRTGMLAIVAKKEYEYAGYLDADLSASLEVYNDLYEKACFLHLDYIFGSRIKMMNTEIKRSWFRHFAGRVIATLIDNRFKLGIYDTQCGAKCFRVELLQPIFNDPFYVNWLFDVEIFLRINKNSFTKSGIESPLAKWEYAKGSKINMFDFPVILKELRILRKKYSKKN